MLQLRPYQRECIDTVLSRHAQRDNRQLISLPTGAGKTVIFANLIKEMDLRTLILVNSWELLDQTKSKLLMICPALGVGLVNQQYKEFKSRIVVCSVQSANNQNNLDKLILQDFDLAIVDECHHFATDKSRSILSALKLGKGTPKLLVGFTATPFRNDNKGLGEVFDVVSYEKDIRYMIENGWLCKPTAFKVATNINLSKVKTSDGDFQAKSLADVMNTPEMNKIIVDAYMQSGNGRKTICFCVNVQHAIDLSQLFQVSGFSVGVVYGAQEEDERSEIVNKYRSGELKVLCNCNLLTEGFDDPETSCIVVARPTKSRRLYQQMVGRGLRLWPNKENCLILDFGDHTHGICNVASLLLDSDNKNNIADTDRARKLYASLPVDLNQRLKAVLINYDPLSESFLWQKVGRSFVLRGDDNFRLEINPQDDTLYEVLFFGGNQGARKIANGLTFEYAFSVADDFANKNRKLFVLYDKNASWRKLAITDQQKKFIQSKGFRAGVDHLTRGQCDTLIKSGVFR